MSASEAESSFPTFSEVGQTPHRSEGALTRRETEVLELLTGGDSDKGIARKIQITEYAVQFHFKHIYRKLGVHDRHAAVDRHGAC